MLWKSTVIGVNLLVCAILALPTHNDIAKSFQAAVDHQNLQTILMSIEERLRNLDKIYSMQLSPTLQDKLEQYHRKLEAIDTKIIRLESLVMLNLDKISENISTKNFKDDISRTNLAKKIDSIYEGVSHRLGYMDRKFETTYNKMQVKVDASLTRLEQMEEGIARRDEDIEAELSDAIAAIDDLKTSCNVMEENIINNTQEYFEVSLKDQKVIIDNHEQATTMLKAVLENTTKNLLDIKHKIVSGLNVTNETQILLKGIKSELKGDLNEYAVKVAEMNSENWKTGVSLKESQGLIEKTVNSTKTEVQNGVRSLMLIVGKNSNKDQLEDEERTQIDELNDKIDSNFEKVFSAQSSFMDNCYRLQMDESQIESKISQILEKLMETFEKKTAIELKDIRNLEKLIKSHDSHITRNLHQTGTNIIAVYEKLTKDNNQLENKLRHVIDHLNALFSLVQGTVADENGHFSTKNTNVLLRGLKDIENKIVSLGKQGKNITGTVKEIKQIAESLKDKNETQPISSEYLRNISEVLSGMEAKINKAYLDYYYRQQPAKSGNQLLNVTATSEGAAAGGVAPPEAPAPSENLTENELDALINQVFGWKAETTTNVTGNPEDNPKSSTKCLPNYRDLVDVRASSDENNNDCPPEETADSNAAVKLRIEDVQEKSALIDRIFRPNALENGTVSENRENKTTNCSQNYGDLIDIRANTDGKNSNDCPDTPEDMDQKVDCPAGNCNKTIQITKTQSNNDDQETTTTTEYYDEINSTTDQTSTEEDVYVDQLSLL